MNRLQTALVDGMYVERSRRSLGEYLPDWLAACRNIRPNTARDYSVSIHKHISPRLGNVRLQSLDRLQIRGLYRKLQKVGSARRLCTTSTSASTKRCRTLWMTVCSVGILLREPTPNRRTGRK